MNIYRVTFWSWLDGNATAYIVEGSSAKPAINRAISGSKLLRSVNLNIKCEMIHKGMTWKQYQEQNQG